MEGGRWKGVAAVVMGERKGPQAGSDLARSRAGWAGWAG